MPVLPALQPEDAVLPGEAQEAKAGTIPHHRRWKRIAGIVGAVLAVLLGLVLVALPVLVSTDKVRQRIIAQAEAITGRSISFRDPPRVTFSPFLGIEISNVIFAAAGGAAGEPPLLQAERLRGRLEILPALLGQIRVHRYQFVRPRFSFRIRADGSASWAFPAGEMWTVLEQARQARAAAAPGAAPDFSSLGSVDIGEIEIVDGSGEFIDERNGSRESVSNLNGAATWRTTGAPASIAARAIWRGEAFALDGRIGQPLVLLAGGSSPLDFTLRSDAISVAFKGEANRLANLQLRGTGRIETPSIRRVMELAGDPLAPGSTLSAFKVSGKLEATQKLLAFSDAEIAMDGNSAKGSLQIARLGKPRPKISGTLAIGALDLSPYTGTVRQDMQDGRNALDRLALAEHMEFDLRISAETATLGGAVFDDVAATFTLRPEGMLIDIGNASAFGGSLTAQAAVKRSAGQATIETKAILASLDARTLIDVLGPDAPYRITGNLTGEASARSYGATQEELLRHLAGSIELEVTNGEIAGIDLAKLRQHAAERQMPADLAPAGQTAFRRLVASLDLYRNLVLVRESVLANSQLDARMSGKAALGPGGIALRIEFAEPAGATRTAPATPDNPVFVGGTIGAPLFSLGSGPEAPTTVE